MSCCNNRISFGIKNLSDTVVKENGIAITPISISAYIASKAQSNSATFCTSRFGYTGIAMEIPSGTDLVLSLNDGTTVYDSYPCIFFGGVPTHRPPHAA